MIDVIDPDFLSFDGDTESLPPEPETGNIEYKQQLKSTVTRIEGLATQMKWRIGEGYKIYGSHDAFYFIGVHDKGRVIGLTDDDVSIAYEKLSEICKACDAIIHEHTIIETKKGKIMRAWVRKDYKIMPYLDYKILCIGDMDTGKTTCISSLVQGSIDNGKGAGRLSMHKHPHELDQGNSSSMNVFMIGYNSGEFINETSGFMGSYLSWIDIQEKSDRIVTITDIPGNKRYQRMKLSSILSPIHDMIFLFFDASTYDNGIDDLLYYTNVIEKLNRRYSIILTKIDLISKKELQTLITMIKKANIKRYVDVISDIDKIKNLEHTVPLLSISNITSDGSLLLHRYINKLSMMNISPIIHNATPSPVVFMVYDIVNKSYKEVIMIGQLLNGTLKMNDNINIIQLRGKKKCRSRVISLHKKKVPHEILYPDGDISAICVDRIPIDDKNISLNTHVMMVSDDISDNNTTVIKVQLDDNVTIDYDNITFIIGNYTKNADVVSQDGKIITVSIPDRYIYCDICNKVILKHLKELYTGTVIGYSKTLDDIV